MGRDGSQQEPRQKNLRLGMFLLGVFVMLYAGSVIFILIRH